jgi:hypothetical protein
MQPKDKENQLVGRLSSQIIISILVWATVMGWLSYRLWRSSMTPSPIMTANNLAVPILNQEAINTLRGSLKETPAFSLPVSSRLEPFD